MPNHICCAISVKQTLDGESLSLKFASIACKAVLNDVQLPSTNYIPAPKLVSITDCYPLLILFRAITVTLLLTVTLIHLANCQPFDLQ